MRTRSVRFTMLLTQSFTLLALVFSALGATFSPHVRHETRSSIPAGWAPIQRAPSAMVVPLRVGLVQPNIESIEEYLMDVSHPESPNYGNHWSAAKVASTFRPSAASIDTVRNWLITEGIEPSRIKVSPAGSWIQVNVTIAEAEGLLKTEYHVYGHDSTGAEHIACHGGYHLPEHVSKHVELVTPTLHFDVNLKRNGPAPMVSKPGLKPGEPGFSGPVLPITQGPIHVSDVHNLPDHID